MVDISTNIPNPVSLSAAIRARVEQLNYERKHPELFKPIEIPHLKDLSQVMGGGLPRGEAVVMGIISKEKRGKTTLGVELIDAWCDVVPEGAIYFCLEELTPQIVDRVLAKRAGISRRSVYLRDVSDEDIELMTQWGNFFAAEKRRFFIQDMVFNPQVMVAQANALGVPLICVDNLQLFDKSTIPGRDAREKLEWVSAYFRQVRNETKLSSLIVAQEGEEGYSFGSGALNRDSDGVLLIKDTMKVSKGFVNGKEKLIETAANNMRTIEASRARLPWEGECTVAFDGDHSHMEDIEVKTVDFNDEGFWKEAE